MARYLSDRLDAGCLGIAVGAARTEPGAGPAEADYRLLCKPTQVSGFITNYQLLDVTRLDSRQAAQLVAATLRGAKPVNSSPKASQQQPLQLGTELSGINISGKWMAEYNAGPASWWLWLLLSQSGGKITGSGVYQGGYLKDEFTILGSVEGFDVKLLTKSLIGDGYFEFYLTFVLHSEQMKGEVIKFERSGVFKRYNRTSVFFGGGSNVTFHRE